jgi:hypothetical protein
VEYRNVFNNCNFYIVYDMLNHISTYYVISCVEFSTRQEALFSHVTYQLPFKAVC